MALGLHQQPSVEETVESVLDYALKAVSATYASVIFVHGRSRVETAAATDPMVAGLDVLQMECGEGPDIDALADRYSVIVSDTHTETRWPTWARRMAESGIRSLLNVRLAAGADTVGTLNLYDPEPNRFDIADQEVAHIFARHAAIALAHAREKEELWRAVDSRKLVGQAQGILMERYSLDADQAFAVLLRYSQHENLKLRAVAERLIATRQLPH
jgi:GAF domain-containing protein